MACTEPRFDCTYWHCKIDVQCNCRVPIMFPCVVIGNERIMSALTQLELIVL